jgi:sugar phosphate isomerase/epimerase
VNSFGYCLNASTLRGTPVLRQIEAAAAAGFGAIELWFADTDAHVAAGGSLREIHRALDDAGLEVPTLIYFSGWFEAPSTEWPRIKDACARRMVQASILGAKHLICSPPEGLANLATGAQRYRELLNLGKETGVTPIFEFLGFVKQHCTIESALEVLTLAGGGTTVLDPFHVFRGGGSIESITQLRADQIAISHFNDIPSEPPRKQQGDSDRVMPGDGTFDLHRYCDLLRSTGYRGWLSLELFRPDLWSRDPLDVAREGFRKMRPFVEETTGG